MPNLVVAKVGTAGDISIYNAQGFTHVVADVVGWFSDGAAQATAFQFDAVHSGTHNDPRLPAQPVQKWARDLGGSVGYPIVADGAGS